jgi:hypothetical protein
MWSGQFGGWAGEAFRAVDRASAAQVVGPRLALATAACPRTLAAGTNGPAMNVPGGAATRVPGTRSKASVPKPLSGSEPAIEVISAILDRLQAAGY